MQCLRSVNQHPVKLGRIVRNLTKYCTIATKVAPLRHLTLLSLLLKAEIEMTFPLWSNHFKPAFFMSEKGSATKRLCTEEVQQG